MIEYVKSGDVVVTRAGNLAIVSDVKGLQCHLKILKSEAKHIDEEVTTLERTGIHVIETTYVRDDDGRQIVRYTPVFRHHITCLATGQLEFAAYEEWADANQSVKDAQLLAAIKNASKVMDDIATHWQLVRV